ncbi:insulinase family protein [Glaciecola sp. 1036]|uniref:insulinase family protein n=1 Tax=Alteromonadaceae TaxID=72275 RepID=UPI003D031327
MHTHSDSPHACLSFSVKSGRFHEKNQCFGFTHLLEHLIFAPNEKYSEAGFLIKEVENQRGEINAWTSDYTSNFHLRIPVESSLTLTEILINKLYFPRFDQANLETEIAAIDAEFKTKIHDEERRFRSVQRVLANKQHPFSRFALGNEQTLGEVPVEELCKQLAQYHSQHFCAANTTLCISLPDTADKTQPEFEQLIKKLIVICEDKIPEGINIPELTLPELFSDRTKAKLVFIRPTLPVNGIIISYRIAKSNNVEVDNCAFTMLQAMLESKHQYGLVDILTEKYLIQNFTITNGVESEGEEELQIRISLPNIVMSDDLLSDIYNIVVSYLRYLHEHPLEEWRYREKQRQLELLHKFKKTSSPLQVCIEIAEGLQKAENIESQVPINLHDEEVKNRFNQIIDYLMQAVPWFYALTKQHEYALTTDYFNVPYDVCPSTITLENSVTGFNMPPQNKYLPSCLLPFVPQAAVPEIIQWQHEKLSIKYFYALEDQKPLGDIYLSVNTPEMFGDANKAISKRLWVEALQQYLNRCFFQTEAAGLYFRVYGHQHGFSIHTSGFTEKQILLIIDILNHCLTFSLSENQYHHYGEIVRNKVNKSLLQKPVNRLISQLTSSVHPEVIEPAFLLDALDSLTFDTLDRLQRNYFNAISIEALCVGNWPMAMVDNLNKHLLQRVNGCELFEKPQTGYKKVHWEHIQQVPLTPPHDNAYVMYYEIYQERQPEDECFNIALALMLESILAPTFFIEMRNIRQLGYTVGVGYKPINHKAGIVFYAQSPNITPEVIAGHVQDILDDICKDEAEINETLGPLKQQLMAQVSNTPKKTADLARHLWLHFESDNPLAYGENLAKAIQQISLQDVVMQIENILQNKQQVMHLFSKTGS